MRIAWGWPATTRDGPVSVRESVRALIDQSPAQPPGASLGQAEQLGETDKIAEQLSVPDSLGNDKPDSREVPACYDDMTVTGLLIQQ